MATGLVGKSTLYTVSRKATKEEIIEHFTKKNMETTIIDKKIKGYRFKPGFEKFRVAAEVIVDFANGNGSPIESHLSEQSFFTADLRSAGVLDLWFEPVYKEEFKAGDKVWIKSWHYETIQQQVAEYVSHSPNSPDPHEIKLSVDHTGNNGVWWFKTGEFRLATPEEIAASQKEVITLSCTGGSFEIEVSQEGIYYRPEDKWLDYGGLNRVVNEARTD